jgi:hypothetical protein
MKRTGPQWNFSRTRSEIDEMLLEPFVETRAGSTSRRKPNSSRTTTSRRPSLSSLSSLCLGSSS